MQIQIYGSHFRVKYKLFHTLLAEISNSLNALGGIRTYDPAILEQGEERHRPLRHCDLIGYEYKTRRKDGIYLRFCCHLSCIYSIYVTAQQVLIDHTILIMHLNIKQ